VSEVAGVEIEAPKKWHKLIARTFKTHCHELKLAGKVNRYIKQSLLMTFQLKGAFLIRTEDGTYYKAEVQSIHGVHSGATVYGKKFGEVEINFIIDIGAVENRVAYSSDATLLVKTY
jgi:hypothetical protein